MRDVGVRIVAAVFEFDREAHPELIEIHVAPRPIDADQLPIVVASSCVNSLNDMARPPSSFPASVR
jgi:hypothetical protein